MDNEASEKILTLRDVSQGDPISPRLFRSTIRGGGGGGGGDGGMGLVEGMGDGVGGLYKTAS